MGEAWYSEEKFAISFFLSGPMACNFFMNLPEALPCLNSYQWRRIQIWTIKIYDSIVTGYNIVKVVDRLSWFNSYFGFDDT